jgi:hypothetical protein
MATRCDELADAITVLIIPAAVIGGLVAGAASLSTFWGVAVTIALLAAWLWVMRRWAPADR